MSSLGSPNPFFIAGKKAYEVERSLRFNDGDSPTLSRTPSSGSNQKKWTWSSWIKISANGTLQTLFSVRSGNRQSTIFLKANGQLQYFSEDSGGTTQANLKTDALLRDPSAWYHVVVYLDAANTTGKIYLNGVEQTLEVSTAVVNTDHNFNTTLEHLIGNEPSQSNYFDGYMAEINFLDSYAYDSSYFGQTDPITGQWNPKKYTGSYGTNGFYLNFSDNSGTTATTLGKDSSGNGNNFTPNNFSVSAGAGNDSLEDTPTNNFATMNPLVPSPSVTWANGNLDLSGSSGTAYSQNNTSTFGVSSGKWYVEVKYTFGGTNNVYVGICPITAAANENMTGSVTDAAVLRMSNETYIEGTSASSGTSISSGDIIGIALDMDNNKVWFSVQGTYISSGNPSTGANATFDGITAGKTMAICGRPLNGTLNFNFGQRAFTYTPPTGFKKLNSANLPDPTILLPNKHFDTLLYTGDGASSKAITGLNFSPDWVWTKRRSGADNHHVFDSVRGASTTRLFPNLTNAEDGNFGSINSFDSNGFTVGANVATNANGETFVGWNWNAGDTDGKTYTVTVVDDSGNKYRFDGFAANAVTLDLAEGGTYIFNYPSGHPFRFSTTADGTHGGGTEYTTGVTVLSSTSIQIVVAASAPTLYYYCSSHSGMGGQINTNSTLGSSNFDGSIQSTVKVNATAGFSIVTWTGTGSNLTIGHGLGVKPSAHISKARTGSSGCPWFVYLSVLGANSNLRLNTNAAVNSGSGQSDLYNDTEPTSSVITIGDSSCINENNGTYITYAFSEVAGYSKAGVYTGNANTDGTFVFTGFRPAWVLLKKTNNTDNWTIFDNKRDIDNSLHRRLRANISDAEATGLSSSQDQIDFLSNGFKMRSTSNNHNGNGATNIFLAFAESPFKNARAR